MDFLIKKIVSDFICQNSLLIFERDEEENDRLIRIYDFELKRKRVSRSDIVYIGKYKKDDYSKYNHFLYSFFICFIDNSRSILKDVFR